MSSSVIYLLRQRNFLPFFLTQFFGAFNDNAFKLSILTLISYNLTNNQALSEYYQAIAGFLFIFPFFLFSAISGQLADKYDKAILARLIKALELFLMIIGSFALYWGSIVLMMGTLMGMGVHSTFFGPIKYAILPEHLPKHDLMGATGLIDGSTFLAILLGTIIGALAIGNSKSTPYVAIFILIGTALAGLIASFFIPKAASSLKNLKVDLHFWRATFLLLKKTRMHFGIFLSILIISWFWFSSAVFLIKLPDYSHYVLMADKSVFVFFLALFSIGIIIGSLMVNLINKGQISFTIVPWGLLIFSFFTFDLYWASPSSVIQGPLLTVHNFFTSFSHWRIAADLLLLSFGAGLYLVPLYTYLEVTGAPGGRASVIAANNIYNALFMVIASLTLVLLSHYRVTIPQIFLSLGLLNFIAAFLSYFFLKRVPLPGLFD